MLVNPLQRVRNQHSCSTESQLLVITIREWFREMEGRVWEWFVGDIESLGVEMEVNGRER